MVAGTVNRKPAPVPDSEERFLSDLERRPVPWGGMLRALRRIAALGGRAQAEERAKLLEDTLAEQGDSDSALAVLEARAEWITEGDARRAVAADAEKILQDDSAAKLLVREAGFDRPAPLPECVRRLRTLLRLAPNTLCYEPTWRFGRVQRIDPFARRVVIDFETRAGHSMALAYAAETLEILGEDHLLSRLVRDPDAIRNLAAERPGDLVVLALRSFGPLRADALREQVVPRILEEPAWKPFWAAARKSLKRDGRVLFPARRSEPLELRPEGESDFDARWFEALGVERDMGSILDRLQALWDAGRAEALDPAARRIVADRLAFVLKGAEPRRWDLWARAVRLAAVFEAEGAGIRLEENLVRFLDDALWFAVLERIGAREIEPLFDVLHRRLGSAFRARLLAALPRLEYAPLSAALSLLRRHGDGAACASALREQLVARRATAHLLLWVCSHPDIAGEWDLPPPSDLAWLALDALEEEAGGALLRSQNRLRDRFSRPAGVDAAFEAMEAGRRREFVMRLKTTSGWPALDRQAILGRLIRAHPEVEEVMAETVPAGTGGGGGLALTSARSYRERQAALEKIVREEIPANSREIAAARAHGDLRENFEYKAAKDMQAVLMKRQAELQQQLGAVQPSDFEGLPSDRAGLATGVELEFDDGGVERVYLLGAWDRDEALGIISSDTRMARALAGKRAGDPFEIDTGHGVRAGRIRSVVPLPPEIRAWIREGD